jgi:hypothetical protein
MRLDDFESIYLSNFQFYSLKMDNEYILKFFKAFKNWHNFYDDILYVASQD